LREYLGDVNYFLEKRQLDNMRQVELRSRNQHSYPLADQQVKAGAALSADEKKQLQRQLQRAEKRIAEIEAEMKRLEEQMGHGDFYTRPDYQQTLDRYQSHKDELERWYREWESAGERLS